jgi:hypothetical protein
LSVMGVKLRSGKVHTPYLPPTGPGCKLSKTHLSGQRLNIYRLFLLRYRTATEPVGLYFGGANEIRTHDLCSAIAALSQLSYGPMPII